MPSYYHLLLSSKHGCRSPTGIAFETVFTKVFNNVPNIFTTLGSILHYQSQCPLSSPLFHIWHIILSSASTIIFFVSFLILFSPSSRLFISYFLLFKLYLLAQLPLLPNNSQLFRSTPFLKSFLNSLVASWIVAYMTMGHGPFLIFNTAYS